jgi:hypothetical protein
MVAIRREAIDAHRRFCCPVPLTTPAPVHACRSCGRRQITDQEGRRRIPSARFCEFPAPHSPSPSILPLSRRLLYTDLTCLTATQLWQHPAWRAVWRLDMSTAGQPVGPVARQPAPNPGRGRGFAPSRTAVRPDHRRLAARCDHRATQSRIVLAFVPALRGRLRTKFRTGIVRGVAARRRGHAGPVAVADTAHTPARVRRAPVRLANYLRARASSSRAANSCRACSQHRHLQSRSCQCTHARYGPASSCGCRPCRAPPYRRGDAGDLAPVDIQHEPAGLQPPAVPTEIQPLNRPLGRLE